MEDKKIRKLPLKVQVLNADKKKKQTSMGQ